MPTYRYECTECARVHEIFHSISDPPLPECPDCGGRVERLIGGGGGVILKGGGFHATDYRSASYRRAEKKEKEAAKPGADAGKKEGDTGKAARKDASP